MDESQLGKLNLGFICPAGLAADARRQHGVKSWRYRYSGAFANTRIIPDAGAVHASEISLVFGTMSSLGAPGQLPPSTPDEEGLSKIMRHGWAQFANDPEGGLTALGWPAYDPQTNSLIEFGLDNTATATLSLGNKFDTECEVWEKSTTTFPTKF